MKRRVGILGGGQLGRMLALAGAPLGLHCRVYDPAADASASAVASHERAGFDDTARLEAFGAGVELATYEWENVPVAAARAVAAKAPFFFPPIAALEMAQDRLVQKEFMSGLGIATAPFRGVSTKEGLAAAVDELGLPAVLKTRREGYDGKGQFVLRDPSDVASAWTKLGGLSAPAGASGTAPGLILEGFVAFEREVSLIAVRGRDGAEAFYPLGENEHREGILRVTKVPVSVELGASVELQRSAEEVARRLLDELDYVGVLSIEFFCKDGKLLVNELATRVHNSGHWTQDGAATSQFENHLRAGAGLPLGSTALIRPTAMVNLIGTVPESAKVLAIPGARLHLYGKDPRPGRKLGHINVPLDQLAAVLKILRSQAPQPP